MARLVDSEGFGRKITRKELIDGSNASIGFALWSAEHECWRVSVTAEWSPVGNDWIEAHSDREMMALIRYIEAAGEARGY